jgi:hypothetical protein
MKGVYYTKLIHRDLTVEAEDIGERYHTEEAN